MAEHRSWHDAGRVGRIALLASVPGGMGGCITAAAGAAAGAGAETRYDERDLEGSKGDVEVKARLKAATGGTQIDASARKHAVEWDRESARQVLARIVSRHG